MSDVRCQMSYVRCQMSDVRCQMSDVRCQISDVRCQMSDVRCQMSDASSSQFTSCSAGPLPRAKLGFIQKPSDPSPSQHLYLVIRIPLLFSLVTKHTFCGYKQWPVCLNSLYYNNTDFFWPQAEASLSQFIWLIQNWLIVATNKINQSRQWPTIQTARWLEHLIG